MIQQISKRWNKEDYPHGNPCLNDTLLKTVENAAVSLIRWELGFGGKLLMNRCSKQVIVVETPVFSRIDTSEFSGPEDEMNILWTLTSAFMQAERAESIDKRLEVWNKFAGDFAGNAFFLVHGTSIFFGQRTFKISMMGIILSQETEKEAIKQRLEPLQTLSTEQLVEVACARLTNPEFTTDELLSIVL